MIPVIQGTDKARLCVEANTTPRSRRLSLLRAYVGGTQYDGRPKWHDKSVPAWEREPCVIWPAASGAITSNEDLLLGEGRYPTVSSRPDEDDGDEDEKLDEESSKALDRLIHNFEIEADLRAHERAQYANGQAVGTIVGIFGARNRKLFADTVDAEFCTPTYNAELEVESLEIKYAYVDVSKDVQGKWQAKPKMFRRVIDANRDVTYLTGEARDDGIEPKWTEDPTKTVVHNLGFCPVLYHRFRTVSTVVNQTDGDAIHGQSLDEIDAFNLEASTRHDGAMHSLPQKIECGVEPGYNPTGGTAPAGSIPATPNGGKLNPISNPQTGHYSNAATGARQQGSRKQGPGYVWQYSDPNTKVTQLELNDGALSALADTMADLRARICEQLAWVPLNPEEVKFAASLSGKALERIMARQINRVSKDRDGFGRGYLLKSYCMLLRIAQRLGTASLKTRGLKKALPVLASLMTDGWSDPPLNLKWGAWFMPTAADDKDLVESTSVAYEAKFITLRTAVEKLARTFGIDDVEAYLEALHEETEERGERESEDLAGSIANAHAKLNGTQGKRTGAGLPGSDIEDGSGGASVAVDASAKDD